VSTIPLSNAQIAERFDLLADLLELDGAEIYRTLAYRRAAKTLRETPESVARMSEEGRLTDLPNVGRTIADKVGELRATGSIAALEKLKQKTPPGIVPLMRVPGIGPKTAKRIFSELGITTFEEAMEAARAGRVREIGGLGEKTEQAILAGAMVADGEKRPRVSAAKLRPFAERVVELLRAEPSVERCEIAGSLRRFTDTAKDIDVVASSSRPADVTAAFVSAEWVAAVEQHGEARAVGVAHDATRVELRVVEPGVFGNLLQHLTGSKDHNVAIREQAVRKGLKVSEYGIEVVETGEIFASDDEADVYGRLGMAWVPPELRENRGEIEAARKDALPALVEAAQIRGDLHVHTDWTDGKATLETMVAAAQARGYGYVNITDHSPAVGFGMGLDAGRLRRQIERVRALAETLAPAFTLLVGCEVDILRDGSLDYSDELLAELDVVVASVHASHRLSEQDQTARICAALENPNVDILGHPSGRMIGRREGYAVDMEAVIAKAVETGTVLEVSGQPARLDLRDTHVRLALQAGAKLAVNTDAHSVAALDYSRFGVMNARRGWATAADVVNTREWPELRGLLKDGARKV
jgi:DNA polymerase (family 10)